MCFCSCSCKASLSMHVFLYCISDTRDIPDIDLVLALSAAAVDAEDTFDKIKYTVDTIIKQYGTDKIRYALMTFGDTPSTIVDFSDGRGKEALRTTVQQLNRPTGDPDVEKALKEAEKLFDNASPRPGSRRIVVIFVDKKTPNSRGDLKKAAESGLEKNVTIIPAVIGPEVDIDEIEVLPTNKEYIAICEPMTPQTWPEIIIDKSLKGKSLMYTIRKGLR